MDGVEKEAKRAEGKLNNQGFLAKAPAAVVDKEKAKLEELKTKLQGLKERMDTLSKL